MSRHLQDALDVLLQRTPSFRLLLRQLFLIFTLALALSPAFAKEDKPVGGISTSPAPLDVLGEIRIPNDQANTPPSVPTPLVPTNVSNSVVRIEATVQHPTYRTPWTPGHVGGGVGSGFVISGNRILTNAHVVSNARFLTVSTKNNPTPHQARVAYIAHDCDLAILVVDNPAFFHNMPPLPIGGIPAIESTVSVYGYPIGGDRLSVTRGIVSRFDFQTYAHSGADSHLAIQIDAAINPGNSGGPVIQDGKVIGVAFQGYSGSVAQNVGYMIPTPVITHFLQDITNGRYDHYMDLGLTYSPLFNPTARAALQLTNDTDGVLVNSVFSGSSTDNLIYPQDILLSIDHLPIASDGSVLLDGQRTELTEVVERKFQGDHVLLEVLRDGKKLLVDVPLKRFPFTLQANAYDTPPRYFIFGGLVFQPLDRDFMEAYQPHDLRLRYYYQDFLSGDIYKKHPEVVVLSNILSDPVNAYANEFRFQIVHTINNTPIKDLRDLSGALSQEAKEYVIHFVGEHKPLVLNKEQVQASRERILNRYGIAKEAAN